MVDVLPHGCTRTLIAHAQLHRWQWCPAKPPKNQGSDGSPIAPTIPKGLFLLDRIVRQPFQWLQQHRAIMPGVFSLRLVMLSARKARQRDLR